MKGLLTKDLMLLRNQSRTLFMLLVCGIIMSFSFEVEIVIMYLAMLGGMVAIGTLGYDEFDNGYCFLLTLPATRKTYVREKYLFCLGWTIFCALIGAAAAMIISRVRGAGEGVSLTGKDLFLTMAATVAVLLVFMALTIPFRLKYGSEKGRIALYVFFGVIAALAYLASRFSKGQLDVAMGNLNLTLVMGVMFAVTIIGFLVSEQISERIMAKKEF